MNSLLPFVTALPSLPVDLVAVRSKAAELPFFPALALEISMGSPSAPPDFAVHVPLRPGGSHTYYTHLLHDCLTPDTLLARSVENLILEFDHPFHTAPALFVSLRHGLDPADVQALAALLVPGIKVPDAFAPYVTHVAAMPSRSPDLLRLNIAGAGIDLIAPAAALRNSLAAFAYNFVCAIDVSPRMDPGNEIPRFGLECYAADWPEFLSHCCRRGWCTPEEASTLLDWPGQSPGPAPSDLPEWSLRTGSFLNAQSCLLRTLNHVKLVCHSGRPPRMKAYLAAFHLWQR